MIFTFILWLHLVAAVIWVGGMLFLVTVLRPAIMKNQGKSCGSAQEKGELLGIIHTRFRTIVGVMIGILFVTGLININRFLPFILSGVINKPVLIIYVKLALAAGLSAIYIVNVIASGKAQQHAAHCIEKPTPQKMRFQLAAILMALGILFCAAWLR